MATKEEIALNNDLRKLSKHFNPKYVTIYRCPTKSGCICSLKFNLHVPTYVATKDCSSPRMVQSIIFYMDVLPNYPKSKPRVYYGNDMWPYHVNVFFSDMHTQCTDRYDPENSNLIELAEKTARAIVFDTQVRRFNSMASSIPEEWQRRMERENKLPTMNPALLFARNIKRTPHSN